MMEVRTLKIILEDIRDYVYKKYNYKIYAETYINSFRNLSLMVDNHIAILNTQFIDNPNKDTNITMRVSSNYDKYETYIYDISDPKFLPKIKRDIIKLLKSKYKKGQYESKKEEQWH